MGFKIGDRVRFKSDPITPRHDGAGTVELVTRRLGVGVGVQVAFDAPEWSGEWHDWSLEHVGPIIPPRGPKPLTLTGGTRFTVTAGLTVRKPPRHWTNDMWLLRAPGRER